MTNSLLKALVEGDTSEFGKLFTINFPDLFGFFDIGKEKNYQSFVEGMLY